MQSDERGAAADHLQPLAEPIGIGVGVRALLHQELDQACWRRRRRPR